MTLTNQVQRAIRTYPGPLRELAKEAGVSHALLWLVLKGKRTATAPVAEKVADALDRCGKRFAEASAAIRQTVPKGGEE